MGNNNASSSLSFLEMVIIWYIYKAKNPTIDELSSIIKVAQEDISSVIVDLTEKGYIIPNGKYKLTSKAFNSIAFFPENVKLIFQAPEEKTKENTNVKTAPTEEIKTIPSTIEVKLPEKKGSIGIGAFATFIITILFAFIPIIGWLASFFGGFIGGIIAKGAGRGALAGFLGIFFQLFLHLLG